MAVSYNPGYQSVLKNLKQSTRQWFVSLEFNFSSAALEQNIVENEIQLDSEIARQRVKFARLTRNFKGSEQATRLQAS